MVFLVSKTIQPIGKNAIECFAFEQIWCHCVHVLFVNVFVRHEGCVGLKGEVMVGDKR